MKKKAIFLLIAGLALGLAIALAGCGSNKAANTTATGPSTEESSPAAVSPAEPATATTEEVERPAVQPEEITGEEESGGPESTGTIAASLQALRSLASYRYKTVMHYTGTGGSRTESGDLTVIGEYSAPDRHHITIIDAEEGTRTEFIEVGDSLWMYNDPVGWTKIPDEAVEAMSQTITSFALDFIWGGLAEEMAGETRYVGKETVNGVRALHYAASGSFWEDEIGTEVGNAHGDIWIAEAGYPLRFVFTASGTDEEGNTESVEWRTEVTEVNTQVVISPPIAD